MKIVKNKKNIIILLAAVFVFFGTSFLIKKIKYAAPNSINIGSIADECTKNGSIIINFRVTNQSINNPFLFIDLFFDSEKVHSCYLPTGDQHIALDGSICTVQGEHTIEVAFKFFGVIEKITKKIIVEDTKSLVFKFWDKGVYSETARIEFIEVGKFE